MESGRESAVRILVLTVIVAAQAAASVVVVAAAAPAPSRMEACAAEWRAMNKAGVTGDRDYKTFSADCMKRVGASVPQPAPTPPLAVAPHKAKGAHGPGSRMRSCAARWKDMKAQGTTKGMTYRQWTSQCLKRTD